MHTKWYNFIIYDNKKLITFINALQLSKGINISQVRYAYILHDKDINEDTGELKKEHYHLWLEFNSAVKDKDLMPFLRLSELDGSAMYLGKTDRNFLAYLTHSTSQSEGIKACYLRDDIHTNIDKATFDGLYRDAVANVNKPSQKSLKDKENAEKLKKIMDIVEENTHICDFYDLCRFLGANNDDDLVDYVCKHGYFMNLVLKKPFQFNKHLNFESTLETIDFIEIENKGDFNDDEKSNVRS